MTTKDVTYCTKVTMDYVEIVQILQANGNIQDLKWSNQRDNGCGKDTGTNKYNNLIFVRKFVT